LVVFEDKPFKSDINENICRTHSIDMAIHLGIFQNKQFTLFLCFNFTPKRGVSVYCAALAALFSLKTIFSMFRRDRIP